MKAPRPKLYLRIRDGKGKDTFAAPAWNRNHTLHGAYALVGGKHEHHPEGVYYLRYAKAGKRVWHSVGNNADVALTAFQNIRHDLEAEALGRNLAVLRPDRTLPPDQSLHVSLDDAVNSHLEEVRAHRAPKTISSAENILKLFSERLAGRLVSQVSRRDLLDHMSFLKARGLSDRTVYNHIAKINSVLAINGVTNILRRADWPRFDEKDVVAYNANELAALLDAANTDERLLFEFFVQTGFREQEVMHCTWANVDFQSKLLAVWSKPEFGFRVKDKEERSVPVPDSLITALAVRKAASKTMLIFPSPSGKPDGHFLRKLQRLAYRAGLNCGECVGKGGEGCATSPNCAEWGLHKFRKTFATMHAEAGVSTPTIQAWLGHSDLATTLRYVAVADKRSERTRMQVNNSFAVLATRSAA